MKYSALLIAASLGVASAARSMCASGNVVTDTINNSYCDKVKGLSFANVGHPSKGQGVTKMHASGCEKGPVPIDSPMAPLDQDVSRIPAVSHVHAANLVKEGTYKNNRYRSRSTSAALSA
jgi:hypothetical protein